MESRHSFSRVSSNIQETDTHLPECPKHSGQQFYQSCHCIQPRASLPSLLTLQPQPNLVALVRSLTPQAQRYISIGIHLSRQVSQPGPSPRSISNGPHRRWRDGRKGRNSQSKTWKRRHQQHVVQAHGME